MRGVERRGRGLDGGGVRAECERVWKWILALVAVVGLSCVGGAVYVYSSGKWEEIRKGFGGGMAATYVRLAEVKKGDLVRTVSAPGRVEPRTKVDISAQVSARIIALPFRDGDAVKKGDVLVRLDAVDLAAALTSAQAQLKAEEARLEGAKASLANASAELGRKRELFGSKDISRAELDVAEAEYQRSEASVSQAVASIDIARANIERAEKDLSNTVIAAEFDGVVTDLKAEVGELVVVGTLNNPGSVIMQVADLGTMLVRARVDEANIAPVAIGQRAKVFINAHPNVVFNGVVERITPLRQQDTDGTAYFEAEVLLEVPEGMRLLSGLTANADIEVQTLRDVLKVPSQAVLDRLVEDLPAGAMANIPTADAAKKYARVVYVMGADGKSVAKPVGVGPSDLTDTVILQGLAGDEKVVVGPFKVLQEIKGDQALTDKDPKAKEKQEKAGAEKTAQVAK